MARHSALAPTAVTVPAQITVGFWLVKLLTTGTGEAASDYLGGLNLVLAGVLGLGGFVAALWWQLRSRTYRPVVYWTAVTAVAVFGTMAADVIHVVLGVPYLFSTAAWAVVVTAVLVGWYRSEGTLSIHSITTARRARFYWATVLATFALGTAAGDLTAAQLNLGYFSSGLLFAGLIAVPLIGWRARLIGEVTAFWTAYVLTRPLGASFADWFGKPHSVGGGLGVGDGTVTWLGVLGIAVGVGSMVVRHRRGTPAAGQGAGPGSRQLGEQRLAEPAAGADAGRAGEQATADVLDVLVERVPGLPGQ